MITSLFGSTSSDQSSSHLEPPRQSEGTELTNACWLCKQSEYKHGVNPWVAMWRWCLQNYKLRKEMIIFGKSSSISNSFCFFTSELCTLQKAVHSMYETNVWMFFDGGKLWCYWFMFADHQIWWFFIKLIKIWDMKVVIEIHTWGGGIRTWITPNLTQRCYGSKNMDSYSSRMVMNESFEIFEKSHLGGPGGALEVGAMIFPL